jgi:hypothetical protein
MYESRKLSPKREGLFKILEVLGPLNYQLDLPKTWRIHPVFNMSLLSFYHKTPVYGKAYLELPPDLIEGEPEYEVQLILRHRRKG